MDTINSFKHERRTNFPYSVGFVGCGNMAMAIASGLLKAKIFESCEIVISGTRQESFERWKHLEVATSLSNLYVIANSRIVFLCVKPNALEKVARSIEFPEYGDSPEYEDEEDRSFPKSSQQTLVSILAGTTIKQIKSSFHYLGQMSIIRAMPNTPLQVCAGATAITQLDKDSHAHVLNYEVVKTIFNTLGLCDTVEESKLHAVTALSGSGPAYVYIIIEALSDAAVKQGLPRDFATKFAAQTVFGASKTILDTEILPAQAKEQVTSAGGTTIYGIHELEKGGIRSTIMNCVEAATKRSYELNKK